VEKNKKKKEKKKKSKVGSQYNSAGQVSRKPFTT
jgi:hypothetical protein